MSFLKVNKLDFHRFDLLPYFSHLITPHLKHFWSFKPDFLLPHCMVLLVFHMNFQVLNLFLQLFYFHIFFLDVSFQDFELFSDLSFFGGDFADDVFKSMIFNYIGGFELKICLWRLLGLGKPCINCWSLICMPILSYYWVHYLCSVYGAVPFLLHFGQESLHYLDQRCLANK